MKNAERIRRRSTRNARLLNLSMYKKDVDHDGDIAKKFRRTMKDTPRKLEFEKFLKKEHSSENSDFLREVDLFKGIRCSKEMLRFFIDKIYETYIEEGSDMEINIFSGTRQKIKKKIDSKSTSMLIFDQAVNDIRTLIMNDSFTRYLSQTK